MNLQNSVYNFVSKIPKGKVTTYGYIGKKINSKAYRAIGQILHRNPNWPQVPCHRVVMKDGSLAPNFGIGGVENQKKLLDKEGVKFIGDKVDMNQYFINL